MEMESNRGDKVIYLHHLLVFICSLCFSAQFLGLVQCVVHPETL